MAPTETIILELTGSRETRRLGRRLGSLLKGGEVIALKGNLGAGKTTLVQGLAQGLGLNWDEVASPTFVLAVSLLGGRLELKHVDLYRLDDEEALELGLEEMMTGPGYENGVTAVEWAERAQELLPRDRIEIDLQWAGPDKRRAELIGLGPEAETILARLKSFSAGSN